MSFLNDNTIYWLWLQKSLGFGASLRELISFYGGVKKLYDAGEASWRESGFFDSDLFGGKCEKIDKMKSTALSDGETVIKVCSENDIDILTPESDLYPENLKNISDYPAVLFVKGDLSCLKNKLPIAVIGTRRPSEYGIAAAEKISRGLAKEDAVIISGGALGIDSIAHKSALAEGAKTILVLGCGHFAKYLPENQGLREDVSKNGAVISEYPPTYEAQTYFFPKRNRIISGLSNGVVIVEAGEKSGTLNTARHAARQNRDIFAVPGDVTGVAFAGSNLLLTEGANAAFSAKDIIGYYNYSARAMKEIEKLEEKKVFGGIDKFQYGAEPEPRRKKTSQTKVNKQRKEENQIYEQEKETPSSKIFTKILPESVSDNAKLVYNYMSGEDNTLDEITIACALPVRKVIIALTELEMQGYIVSLGGGNYKKA